MPDFYPSDATTRSQSVLGEIAQVTPHSVLIGGWGTRPDTLPGAKDRYEILGLLELGVQPSEVATVLVHASQRSPDEFADLVRTAFAYLAESGDDDGRPLPRKQRDLLRQVGKDWVSALA